MSGRYQGLCVLTPVEPDRLGALREGLLELPPDEGSPLARIEGTHYARWETLHLKDRSGKRDDTLPPYLLFAAEFDGAVGDYVEALIAGLDEHAHAIWGHCAGYPGREPGALAAYLEQHRIEPGYSIVAYPGASVDRVRSSLALAQRLHEFLVRARALDPVGLKRAWLESFRRDAER
jgi:hypothetical protein